MDTSPCTLPVPTAWADAVARFETVLRAAGRRETTIATRLRHVRQLARALPDAPPDQVTSDQLLTWAGAQHWQPETRHAYYVSIRLLYAAIELRPSPADALPPISRPVPPPRPTPETVYRRALADADERTRAILTLAGAAGLRRSEIVQVNIRDLIDDLTATSLVVHAKGGRDRLIPLTDELTALIRTMCATSPEGWASPSRDGGHITPRWAARLASRVLPPGWSLHTLRHRFATTAYAADRDLLAVQRLLGHTSVATTQRYTAPPDNAMRQALNAAA
ncbi:tyrosine-type recombinase/integrase [Actinomyces respiraculi]|uniref:tyrosine-type recombinase/integrase n=1 Tax=Actinomyces respiraculi TaxID=2744574 RepID=UPI0014237F46|nr:tyrosine-type recombinase/integrase [Actinomyces respiraculi]